MPRFFDPLLKLLMRSTDQELLAQIQFLKAENRILRQRLPKVIRLSHAERLRLLALGVLLRWSVLKETISVVHPSTFSRWVHKYKAGSHPREYNKQGPKVGRPPTPEHIRALVIRIARETGLGYTRIQGELNKLGVELSRSTITNILKSVGMSPDPHRGEGRWDEFISMHAQTLWACDFLSINTMTKRGIKQFYLLLFIHIGSRKVLISSATQHPTHNWVSQQARNFCITVEENEQAATHLIRDCEMKFNNCWNEIIAPHGIRSMKLPRHSPNLNAFAERAIQSVKQECLNHFVICGERHLNDLVQEYVEHYNNERLHSSIGRLPPMRNGPYRGEGRITVSTRLGGLLKHYYRNAA